MSGLMDSDCISFVVYVSFRYKCKYIWKQARLVSDYFNLICCILLFKFTIHPSLKNARLSIFNCTFAGMRLVNCLQSHSYFDMLCDGCMAAENVTYNTI